jgi:hypothetical protein
MIFFVLFLIVKNAIALVDIFLAILGTLYL